MQQLESQSYQEFLLAIKKEIQTSRIKAHIAVNRSMIELYYRIGKAIISKREKEKWGAKVIENIALALRSEFPEMKGLSYQNISYMQQFAKEYPNADILQQAVGEIPWGHNIAIFSKVKELSKRLWYANKTVENGWSRNVLAAQIKSCLYERSGKGSNNFKSVLSTAQSDLVSSIIKDPYNLDFLDIREKITEREFENKLIKHIRDFLLELGQGFAFVGNQYHLSLDGEDYYIDLLFYHIKLKCYVVIELKIGQFKPEYAGKLNFYLNLVDKKVKDKSDNPSIGIILCEEKKGITVEYALEGMEKPLGVSEFRLTEKLPVRFRDYLPTKEALQKLGR